jgi:hypothetical protein
VPNRTSIWARIEKTPFGQGHPYSLLQVHQFLKKNSFIPLQTEYALYIPPSQSRFVLSTASAWEKLGHKWFRNLSGVFIIEASKQVYASTTLQKVTWKEKFQLPKKLALPLNSIHLPEDNRDQSLD